MAVLIPFITMPYVTRVLNPEGCGIYSFTHANITYFVLFSVLGTAGYGVRTIARNRDNIVTRSKLFWEIELLTVVSSMISLIAFFIFFYNVNEYKTYYLILSGFIISALLDISWFFTGLERIGYMTSANILIKILGTICIFLFVKSPDDLTIYILINVSIQVVSNLSMWLFIPQYLVRVSFKELQIFRHLKETLIFFIPTIAISIYTVLDKTLIGLITHETAQNGYYDNATQIIGGVKAVVYVSIGMVMGARTSYLFAQHKTQEVKDKIQLTMNYIMFLALGCGFGILAVADNFVPLFLGNKFTGAIPLLKLMTPLVAIIGISNCLGSLYYSPVGKRKTSAEFIIIGAIINLIFNLILIPHLGAVGATIGTIIAESTISFLYLLFCDHFFTFKQLLDISFKKLTAGVIMLFAVKLIGQWNANAYIVTFVQIVSGAVIYISLLALMQDFIVKMGFAYTKKRLQKKPINSSKE